MSDSIVAMTVEIKSNGIKAMADNTYDVKFNFPETELQAVMQIMRQKADNPIGKFVFVPQDVSFDSETDADGDLQ